MTFRQVASLAVVALVVGACKKDEPPVSAPAPVTEDEGLSAAERARADSIARAEAARAEADARERAAVAARARTREELTGVVYFEYDSEQLTSEAEAELRDKAAILRANPTLSIRIEGHADERGSTEYNLALGQRRAETVRNFLAGYGIGAGRLTTISYGEERPAVQGASERAFAQNRRAEFEITGGEITTAPPGVGR